MVTVTVQKGPHGLAAIREEWLGLLDRLDSKSFFHLYEWYESYLHTLEENPAEVFFFLLYRDNRLTGIMPLKRVSARFFGLQLSALMLPYHPHMPLCDILLLPGETLHDYMRAFAACSRECAVRWDILHFTHVPASSHAMRSVTTPFPTPLVAMPNAKCDYIECDRPYDAILSSFSKNFRANLRKARNKLSQSGFVTYQQVRDPAQLPSAFNEFLEVEASGWKGQRGSAIKLNPNITEFYRSLLMSLADQSCSEINLLKINSECIAGQFCLLVDAVRYVLKIGYDENYSKLAPGNMLLEHVIRQTGDDRDIRVVNLVTDASWHNDWMPQRINIFDIYLCNRTISGLVVFTLLQLKKFIRPFYHRHLLRETNTPDISHAPHDGSRTTSG